MTSVGKASREKPMSSQAIVCYQYGIEVSPFLKNVCSYLYDHGFGTTDVFVDDLYRDQQFCLPGGRIINLAAVRRTGGTRTFFRPWWSNRRKFQEFVSQYLEDYSLIFAVDFPALDVLHQASFDLSRVVYLSLESIDYLKKFNKKYVRQLLSQCAVRVIQNAGRAADVNNFLGSHDDYLLFPVSKRPITAVQRCQDGPVRFVYSGYFSEWSGVREFVSAFIRGEAFKNAELVLHGHAMGTESYLDSVKKMIDGIPNIKLDLRYMDDTEHDKFLSGFDIGLAPYLNVSDSANLRHVLTSSGKVASYLWNGLAVVTNVNAPEVCHPPFIHVPDIVSCSISEILTRFVPEKDKYRKSALDFAGQIYNFDKYMIRLESLAGFSNGSKEQNVE